jgi:hypothetical protein
MVVTAARTQNVRWYFKYEYFVTDFSRPIRGTVGTVKILRTSSVHRTTSLDQRIRNSSYVNSLGEHQSNMGFNVMCVDRLFLLVS